MRLILPVFSDLVNPSLTEKRGYLKKTQITVKQVLTESTGPKMTAMAEDSTPKVDPGLKAVLKELHRRKLAGEKPANKKDLGAKIKLSKQAVSKWTRVPSERAIAVEEATGVSRYIMRPDVFGKAPKRKVGKRVRSRSR